MAPAKRLAALGLTAVCLYLLWMTGGFPGLRETVARSIEAGRMKNVTVSGGEAVPEATAPPEESETPEGPEDPEPAAEDSGAEPIELLPAALWAEAAPAAAVLDSGGEDVRETTIQGGLQIKNATRYPVDVAQILAQGPSVRLPAEGAQILIVHTHGSEAYTQAGLDRYEANDSARTEDTEYNIIRVGDELARLFEEAGLRVVHDRGIYDYPSYTGSYTRSGEAVERALEENPGIAVVIDLHRDALGSDDVIYKTMAEEDGVCASQVMILVGSDDSGLEHPNWRSNLALALYLQQAVDAKHPTLMRPVSLVRERYNQHLTGGSMIVEVGSSGNTLQEALAAIRLFADGAAPALAALVEEAPPAIGEEPATEEAAE